MLNFIFIYTLGLSLPNIPKDFVILYFLVAVSTYNSNYDVKERLSASIFELCSIFIEALLWPISIWFRDDQDKEQFFVEVLKMLSALILFILFNAAAYSTL